MSEIEIIQDHRAKVKGMIERHKLVEDLVHRQDMQRHDLVESMVHESNLSELRRFLDKIDSSTLARLLDSLSTDERQIIWQLVSEERKEEVLLEVSDSVRVEFVSEPKPQSQSMVIRVFDLHEGRLRQIPIYSRDDLAQANPIWVDLVTPEDEQLAWAREIFGVNLPNPKELTDLESSARF
jgi:magnesium transporter